MSETNEHLSRRERQIMHALYEAGEQPVQGVRERMPSPPGYSAVRATLAKLVEKGEVSFREDGPRYLYSPSVARDSASTSALQGMLKTFFSGSRVQAVSALLGMSRQPLSDEEIDELQNAINEAKRVRAAAPKKGKS